MTRLRSTLVAGAAVLIAALVFLVRESTPDAPAPVARPEPEVVERKSSRPAVRPASPAGTLPVLPLPVAPPHPAESPLYQDWLETRIGELEALAGLDDAASLDQILAELRSPAPEIRAAAIAATREFGSRDAVPHLRKLAEETQDPDESTILLELIDYLELPTMIEQFEGDIQE